MKSTFFRWVTLSALFVFACLVVTVIGRNGILFSIVLILVWMIHFFVTVIRRKSRVFNPYDYPIMLGIALATSNNVLLLFVK
jgi:hypothetical protein